MNAEFKAWLLSHGFLQTGRSCVFYQLSNDCCSLWRVWLHEHGGQAEISEHDHGVIGKRLTRLEYWKSIEELQEFFGKELEK